jgi:hypothetical protein
MAQLQVHAKITANGAVVATTPLRSMTSTKVDPLLALRHE